MGSDYRCADLAREANLEDFGFTAAGSTVKEGWLVLGQASCASLTVTTTA